MSLSESKDQRAAELARKNLARSGLSLDRVSEYDGCYPLEDASKVHAGFRQEPALVMPYHDLDGKPLTYVEDGRALTYLRVRYLSPTLPGLVEL